MLTAPVLGRCTTPSPGAGLNGRAPTPWSAASSVRSASRGAGGECRPRVLSVCRAAWRPFCRRTASSGPPLDLSGGAASAGAWRIWGASFGPANNWFGSMGKRTLASVPGGPEPASSRGRRIEGALTLTVLVDSLVLTSTETVIIAATFLSSVVPAAGVSGGGACLTRHPPRPPEVRGGVVPRRLREAGSSRPDAPGRRTAW